MHDALALALEHLGQHRGVVDLGVARAIDQRDLALARAQLCHRRVVRQFRAIAPGEFLEAFGLMAEPFAQSRRGCKR